LKKNVLTFEFLIELLVAMYQVVLANSRHFSCKQDETILDAAMAAGLMLEHSCRTGKCGVCKAQVLSGSTLIKQAETALDSEQQAAGYILTCCRQVTADTALDIEDLGDLAGLQRLTLPARIDTTELLSKDVIRVVLRLPPNNSLKILSGQYIDVMGPDNLRRSYSIANYFVQGGKIELHIRKVDNGKMSHYWFENAKANDLLRIEGPHGTFCLRDKPQSQWIFLATGTGMAPIKSLLEYLDQYPELLNGKRLSIYWGGRTTDDIYWQPQANNIRFDFFPVLSRADDSWQGLRGYVQDQVIQAHPQMDDCVVYACGSPQMIDSASRLFATKSLGARNFLSDAFVSS
jgi:CDP-4-dehydro-6-deoxyglucose reductase